MTDPLAAKRSEVLRAILAALPGEREADALRRDVEHLDEPSLDRLLLHYDAGRLSGNRVW